MMVSPFTIYRGAAKIMAADLKDTPAAGLLAQLCGETQCPVGFQNVAHARDQR
jgi:uncharacterized protein (DUF2252 family)